MKIAIPAGSYDQALIPDFVFPLLAAMEDGVFVLDRSLRIIYFNSSTKKQLFSFYGMRCRLGEYVIPHLPENRKGPLLHYFNYVLEGNSIKYQLEIPGQHSSFWVECYFFPVKDGSGNVTAIGGNIKDITDRHICKTQLEERSRDLSTILKATIEDQERERELLSTELHENVSQVLATTKLYLEMASINEKSRIDFLKKGVQNLTNAINDLRLISYSLLPSSINDIGIVASIRELIQPYINANKFEVHFSFSGDLHLLSKSFKVNLFRIIQEHLSNIAIHSDAANVYIQLSDGEKVSLFILHDGKRFDKGPMLDISQATIRNRTELFDGSADFYYRPPAENLMELTFPLASCH